MGDRPSTGAGRDEVRDEVSEAERAPRSALALGDAGTDVADVADVADVVVTGLLSIACGVGIARAQPHEEEWPGVAAIAAEVAGSTVTRWLSARIHASTSRSSSLTLLTLLLLWGASLCAGTRGDGDVDLSLRRPCRPAPESAICLSMVVCKIASLCAT